jgi:hypothetical protein
VEAALALEAALDDALLAADELAVTDATEVALVEVVATALVCRVDCEEAIERRTGLLVGTRAEAE